MAAVENVAIGEKRDILEAYREYDQSSTPEVVRRSD